LFFYQHYHTTAVSRNNFAPRPGEYVQNLTDRDIERIVKQVKHPRTSGKIERVLQVESNHSGQNFSPA